MRAAAALVAEAGVDSGVWSSCGQVLGGSASGGVAPYSYSWAITSGGSGSISGGTTTTPTVTPTAPGTGGTGGTKHVLTFTVTDFVGTIATDTVELDTSFNAVVTLGTGFTRHWFAQATSGTVTRDGSNLVSQINDNWANAFHMTQGSTKELYEPTAGPGSTPTVTPNGTSNHTVNTAIALSTNRRLMRIVVAKVGTTNTRVAFLARDGNGAGTGDHVLTVLRGTNVFQFITKQNGGAETATNITTPAVDGNFHVFGIHYQSTGLYLGVDGTATSPQPTGSAGAVAIEAFAWGATVVSGGSVAADVCIESDSTAMRDFITNALKAAYGL